MKQQIFEKLIDGCDNVIFDYGGVFVDIKHEDTIAEFAKLSSVGDASKLYGKHGQTKLFSDFEVGAIDPSTFIQGVKRELGICADDAQVERAWCAMLKEHPGERVKYLREISKSKRVFMLSNINQIHEEYLADFVSSRPEIRDFYSIFEKVYFSHKIGKRKPDPESFREVLIENGLDPSKTAFIDDTMGHVEASRSVGIRGILLDPANTFIV